MQAMCFEVCKTLAYDRNELHKARQEHSSGCTVKMHFMSIRQARETIEHPVRQTADSVRRPQVHN